MPSFTIKQLDDRVLERLRRRAREQGKSLSALIRELLRRSVGLEPGAPSYSDLSDLAGSWSKEELEEFQRNVQLFERIDPELWD